jgi:nucleoside-diphosphate-sugar epimerase
MQWSGVDLTNLDDVRRMFRRVRPDVVFHLAGHVTGSQRLEEVQPTFAANLISTVHLLTIAAENPTSRIVLAGSMQEPDGAPGIASPSSPYAASKWACSGYARMFQSLYGLRVAIARPMLVYGPGQWDLTKLLPYVIVSLLKGESPKLTSGERQMDWVFVDDVVAGLIAVAASPVPEGETIDLGSGELTTIRQVVEKVTALIASAGEPLFGAVPDRLFEVPRLAQVEKTAQLIGWKASTPLAEGLARTVDWYRQSLGATPIAFSAPFRG